MTQEGFDRGDYRAWNRQLVDHYFNPSKHGRQVRLSLDEETLSDLGGDRDDLVLAVLVEAEDRECKTIQDLGLYLYACWINETNDTDEGRGETPPPFVAVLALYVMAVNYGGSGRPAHAFYDRLHDLLERGGAIARIDSIKPSLKLWRHLASWATHDLGGRLGIFRVGVVGEQRYVGIPRRQILLAPREHRSLEAAFSSAHLTPGSDPSDPQLHAAARSADGLLNRTRKLLECWPSVEAARDLISEIRSHLEDWDAEDFVSASSGRTLLPLNLELHLSGRNIVAGRFQTDLVPGLTDTDHTLTMTDGPDSYRKQSEKFEMRTGDSKSPNPIVVDASKEPAWATAVSWFDSIAFEVRGENTLLRRQASNQRVFKKGHSPDLLQEVRERDVRAGEECLLIARTPSSHALPSVVGEFKGGWQKVGLQEASYRVFLGADQSQDKEWYPEIRLVGGIPTQRGKRAYLSFGLPDVVLDLPPSQETPDIRLRVHDEQGSDAPGQLTPDLSNGASDGEASLWDPSTKAQTKYFHITDVAQRAVRCEIEIAVNGEVIASRGFYVDREPVTGESAPHKSRDALGLITESKERTRVRGMTTGELDSPPLGDLPIAHDILQDHHQNVRPDDAAQRVMLLMRTRHRLSWGEAKRLLPGCLPKSDAGRPGSHKLIREVKLLHSLGILELEESASGGFSALTELPPKMVLLPRRANRGYFREGGTWASHQAVLTGCWLPDYLDRVKAEAKRVGADFHVISRPRAALFSPHCRSVLATGPDAMRRLGLVAKALQVDFDGPVPFACRLASVTQSIDDLVSHPDWTPGRPANTFERWFFDPRKLSVSERPSVPEDRYVLWECRDQDRPTWHFFIVDSERRCRLEIRDRQVARWFVRRQALPQTPIPSGQHQILIPLELRFPPLLERLLTLSSGLPLELKAYEKGQSPFRHRRHRDLFTIPAPPESGNDRSTPRGPCSGIFCLYRGVHPTAAWPLNGSIPMLGVLTDTVSTKGLKEVVS